MGSGFRRGMISIDPPIPWGNIRDSPYLPKRLPYRNDGDVRFVLAEETVDVDEGRLRRISAGGIEATDNPRRGDRVAVAAAVNDIIKRYGAGRVFGADPWREYIQDTDLEATWRCVIRDGVAVAVDRATLPGWE